MVDRGLALVVAEATDAEAVIAMYAEIGRPLARAEGERMAEWAGVATGVGGATAPPGDAA